jgi:eukaryotic-like serine/threonine-protein kinase
MNKDNQSFSFPPGTIIGGKYQIIKLIGKGGMAWVYQAYDNRLDLKVAIKIVSPELLQSMDEAKRQAVLQRFEAEAQIAAKLDHPNIIRIYGIYRETVELDGAPHEIDYLAMELLAGRTLRNTMDASGFEHEEEISTWIAKFMIPILDGLQKVHESGIIHRDIKPENFLLKEDAPKLADFGLSMGVDLPSVTTAGDIFGTLHYMAPEQFYNFSMAREPADIYSIGKILFEIVEGKMSDKAKPFKQVELSNKSSDFLGALNAVIMAATAENQHERIQSAQELKSRLMQLLYCAGADPARSAPARSFAFPRKAAWPAVLVILLVVGGIWEYSVWKTTRPVQSTPHEMASQSSTDSITVNYLPAAGNLKSVIYNKDRSELRLIPPAELQFADKELLGVPTLTVPPFYISHTPITNQQFVNFLNASIERVTVADGDVFLNEQLVLKISEKIRGYKPIGLEDRRFVVKNPMHSSCAVLLVTGYGAQAYAAFYKARLPRPEEWLYVKAGGGEGATERKLLPLPVLNYEENKFGLRGIDQLAEWGRTQKEGFVIMGQTPSTMVEGRLVSAENPDKYFTDTGFRVARDVQHTNEAIE